VADNCNWRGDWKERAALGEGVVTLLGRVTTEYESVKNHQKINEIWFFLQVT